MKKLLLADDHVIIRKGMKLILQAGFPHVEIGEASTAKEILCKVKQEKWDILVLDMHLRDENGLDVLRQLEVERLHVRTLIFSSYSEQMVVAEAFRLGAWGYLEKDNSDEALFEAVRQIANGKKYRMPALAEVLI